MPKMLAGALKIVRWLALGFSMIGLMAIFGPGGDLGGAILFTLIAVGIIWLSRDWPKKTKVFGSVAILILCCGFVVFSQTPKGRLAYSAMQLKEKQADIENAKREQQSQAQVAKSTPAVHTSAIGSEDIKPLPVEAITKPTSPDTDVSTTSSQDMSAAVQLAAIDAGQYVDPNDPVVGKYQAQFDSLRAISSETNDHRLADMAYISSQAELKKGVEETNLSVLEAVNQSCPSNISHGKHLSDMFALYTTLRQEGVSREEAISQLHGLVTSIVHPGQ